MLHLYWGDGKGKTTAAMGLALRALGHGWRVCVVQLLKDGSSGEAALLRQLGADVLAGQTDGRFSWELTEPERTALRQRQTALVRRAMECGAELIILDEACAACGLDLVDEAALRELVLQAKVRCEVVLTGREPAPWMQAQADYSTRMQACAHPYARGAAARAGIEY